MNLSSRPADLLGASDSNTTKPEPDDFYNEPAHIESRHGMRTDNTNLHKMAEITEAEDVEMKRPPYLHAMLAGGVGGTSGDILMHSLDTVKTRQQGDPHWPPRYRSLGDAYLKILRQEGVRRGLYGGFTAAMLGSFPGTVVFFGTYEFCKRSMLDRGLNPSFTYLTSGLSTPSYYQDQTNKHRIHGRLGRFSALRTLRSPQNPSAAPRSIQ